MCMKRNLMYVYFITLLLSFFGCKSIKSTVNDQIYSINALFFYRNPDFLLFL